MVKKITLSVLYYLKANAPNQYYLNSLSQINQFVKHSYMYTKLVSPLANIKAYCT